MLHFIESIKEPDSNKIGSSQGMDIYVIKPVTFFKAVLRM